MKTAAQAVARYAIARIIFVGLAVYAINVLAPTSTCAVPGGPGLFGTLVSAETQIARTLEGMVGR